MNERMTLPELESYLWGAAIILRGLVEAGDYKQCIFPLLFYKRISDVWDEEYAAAFAETGDAAYARATANDRFVIPDGAHWQDVRAQSKDVGQAIRDAMREIERANPERLDGIFGNAPWTNKSRLSDSILKNMLEHFSKQTLSLTQVPEDELGIGYEFLIKKFADDSGHTAQEFYTNRTVVHLMVQILDPKPGESVYDPTCGTGGMLISALDEVKRSGGEYRTLRLYGQERNHMTASIARMNLVLHGLEDFTIARGDTLERPAFTDRDRLRTCDIVLANPPYSIKQWNREAWQNDPWGRNFLGTPPQGRADYAFFQHILCSMDPETGRCAILFPHGVLFRKEEAEMRRKLVEADLVECVLGLGPNLFYNSPMEACVVICRSHKPPERQGRILFIDAVNEVARERAQSFLKPEHQDHIATAYHRFADEAGFARVATQEEIARQDYSLSIPLYVKRVQNSPAARQADAATLPELWSAWEESGRAFWQEMDELVIRLDELVSPADPETVAIPDEEIPEEIPTDWYAWLDQLPLDALKTAGILPNLSNRGPHKATLTRGALYFFGVKSPADWQARYNRSSVAYRRSQPERSDAYAIASWLRIGELQVGQQPPAAFDKVKFIAALHEIRTLTVEPIEVFEPRLKELCAASGVTLLLTPAIPRARVSGAARWVNGSPVIQLSLYGKKNDRFWFTFFHEACHILNHSNKLVFLDEADDGDWSQEEQEANRFAEEWLIPAEVAHELPQLSSREAVRQFAGRIGIHPGIVVGRLQHEKLIERSWMNDLRVTISWNGEYDH